MKALHGNPERVYDAMKAHGKPMSVSEIKAVLPDMEGPKVQGSILRLVNLGYVRDTKGIGCRPHVWEVVR